MKPKISVIVLNWKGYKDSRECLNSLMKQKYQNLEIILVDNESDKNELEKIKKEFPKIITKANNENFGYAKGNNIGIKCAINNGADYVFILNNDTIINEQIFDKLLKEFDKNTAIVSPVIYYFKNNRKIWSAGGSFNKTTGLTTLNHSIPNKNKVSFIPGTAMLIDLNKLKKIGYFNERYFLYYEDTDLCQRFIKKGYSLKIAKNSKILHSISNASGGEYSSTFLYYMTRNHLYNSNENLKGINKFTSKIISPLFFLFLMIKAVKYNQDPNIVNIAISDYIKGKMGKR